MSAYQKEHLVAGETEHRATPHTDDAILAVLQFRQPAGATSDLAIPSGATTTFTVPGIPGAVGTAYGPANDRNGVNVTFAAGDDEYVVGYAPTSGQPGPGRSGTIKAARAR